MQDSLAMHKLLCVWTVFVVDTESLRQDFCFLVYFGNFTTELICNWIGILRV